MRFTKCNPRLSKTRIRIDFQIDQFQTALNVYIAQGLSKVNFYKNVGSELKNYRMLQLRWDWHVTSVTTY